MVSSACFSSFHAARRGFVSRVDHRVGGLDRGKVALGQAKLRDDGRGAPGRQPLRLFRIPGHCRDRVAALDQRAEHRRPDVAGGAG